MVLQRFHDADNSIHVKTGIMTVIKLIAEKATANGKRLSPDAEKIIIDVYMQAINYLEKAKDMDKTMEFKSVWAYSLYTCCYRALGPDDAKTKEAEMLTK